MIDLSKMSMEQLRGEMVAAQAQKHAAEYQDSHRAYLDMANDADARIVRVQNEIALREAHNEAIHGR